MHDRILLCASPRHCAQVLRAAAAARVHVHGLRPLTEWPAPQPDTPLLLWALLPATASAAEQATEAAWRAQLLQGTPFTIRMLYGTAEQQARQLAPWVPSAAPDGTPAADCPECLDARSEQSLFQHLLQRHR